MPDLEYPACMLCHANDATRRYEREFAPYALAHCNSCGFHYLSPRLAEAAMAGRYESPDYYASGDGTGYASFETQAGARRATYRRLVQTLREHGVCGGRLLEIGAGYGYFLAEARAAFSRCDATELEGDAAQRARVHADEVLQGGLESVPSDRRYDLIVALQVIEHVYDPLTFVRHAAQLLNPGGHLLLAAPDMGSPFRKWLGAHWPSYKIPEHVGYFDERSLARLMSQSGLTAPRVIAHPDAIAASQFGSWLGVKLPKSIGQLRFWMLTGSVAVLASRS